MNLHGRLVQRHTQQNHHFQCQNTHRHAHTNASFISQLTDNTFLTFSSGLFLLVYLHLSDWLFGTSFKSTSTWKSGLPTTIERPLYFWIWTAKCLSHYQTSGNCLNWIGPTSSNSVDFRTIKQLFFWFQYETHLVFEHSKSFIRRTQNKMLRTEIRTDIEIYQFSIEA